MPKATPARRDQSGGGSAEYRKRLRSYHQNPVRRSPRFLPQNNTDDYETPVPAENLPYSTKKPSFQKTHFQSTPTSPAKTLIPAPKCSKNCPNEPLRPINNLQRSSNPSQRKPLRRSPRLASLENEKGSSEPVKERREASEPVKERQQSLRLMEFAKVSDGKENVIPNERIFADTVAVGNVKKAKLQEDKENVGTDKNVGSRRRKERNLTENMVVRIDRSNENVQKVKGKRKLDDNSMEKLKGEKMADVGKFSGSGEWTKEQDTALQRAYLVAKPSPHFWKKVARMVPGKPVQDCFDRVNSSFDTPPQPQPRSRSKRSNLSPIANFSLSASKPAQLELPLAKKLSSRKKSLAAQKTVRHLLRKHCVNDQMHEADHFSVLETSPAALAIDLPSSSPITPDCLSSPPSILQKRSGGLSSARQKMPSMLSPLSPVNRPSPAVLKRVKNMPLHEKYIDQLHCREARRRFAASSSVAARACKNEMKAGGLEAARTALMCEANEFISHFRHAQANCQSNSCVDDDDDYGDDEEEDE